MIPAVSRVSGLPKSRSGVRIKNSHVQGRVFVAIKTTKSVDPTLTQLEQIKKLLILHMIVSGTRAKDIAKVLGVGKATISRLVPARGIDKRRGNSDGK